MNRTIVFPKEEYKPTPAIKNTLVEKMFLKIANDAEMDQFMAFIREGAIHRATAYASRKVAPIFDHLVEREYAFLGYERFEALKEKVYRKDK